MRVSTVEGRHSTRWFDRTRRIPEPEMKSYNVEIKVLISGVVIACAYRQAYAHMLIDIIV